MSKFLRDLKKIAEEEGYEYAGYAGAPGGSEKQRGGAGSGHHVFIHTATGAVMRTASTPKSESNALKYARANFRNSGKRAKSKAALFRTWILKRYKIGKNGSKVVELSIPEVIGDFNAEHPELTPMSADHFGVMMGNDPMFDRQETKPTGTQHQYVTVVRISGPAYGLTKDEPEAEVAVEEQCGEQTHNNRDGGIAICTNVKGHGGMHFDKFRNYRWVLSLGVPAPESEPVIDPVAQAAIAALPKAEEQMRAGIKIVAPTAEEIAAAQAQVEAALAEQPSMTPTPPVLEPVTVGGLTLSDELADQLREALGVPSAALAVEAQDAAVTALQDAQAALQRAMDAIKGVPVVKTQRRTGGKDTNFGSRGQLRIANIQAAVADGRLGMPFTVTDVERVLGLTEGQAVSILAKANRLGVFFRRIAPNTYEVR